MKCHICINWTPEHGCAHYEPELKPEPPQPTYTKSAFTIDDSITEVEE